MSSDIHAGDMYWNLVNERILFVLKIDNDEMLYMYIDDCSGLNECFTFNFPLQVLNGEINRGLWPHKQCKP